MFRKLSGRILEKSFTNFVIDCNGVGYLIQSSPDLIGKVTEGSDFSCWIYTSVQEKAIDLYGFENRNELDFFELLLTISGVGPKSALSIISTAPIETLREGVCYGDASYLSKISGIGKKTAEKIVIGLKDKVGDISLGKSDSDSAQGTAPTTAIDALVSLGYSERDAREAIQKIKGEGPKSAEEMIKEALRNLNK